MKKVMILLALATLAAAPGCCCTRLCPLCPCNWFNRAPVCPPTYAAPVATCAPTYAPCAARLPVALFDGRHGEPNGCHDDAAVHGSTDGPDDDAGTGPAHVLPIADAGLLWRRDAHNVLCS